MIMTILAHLFLSLVWWKRPTAILGEEDADALSPFLMVNLMMVV
jgi:hypothetical protein